MSISFDEFNKKLGSMEGRLAKNINKAMKANALRMEAAAYINATSFPRVIDNRLRGSITGTVINFQEDDYLILRAGGITAPNRPFSESADVVYAAIQEFGGNTDMEGGARYIKPKFYLKRARDKIKPIFERDLKAAAEATLKGEMY